MENISSEQELKEMLEEGKITEEEYQQLLEAIRKQPKPDFNQETAAIDSTDLFPFPTIPWQIYVIIAILALEGISNLLMIFGNPSAIVWLALKVVFIIGLLRGSKWVFVLFQIIAGLHVLYFAAAGAWIVSLINFVLMILAFTAIRYYFPAQIDQG